MKVLLFVVENRDDIRTEYAKLLVHLAWNRWVDGIRMWTGQRRTVWFMRQQMVKDVLADPNYKEATHFLFIDSDVIPKLSDGNFVERLKEGLKDCDAISGYYCNTDGVPMNKRNGARFLAPNGTYEMETISMGYSLWKREVWEKVEYPEPVPSSKLDADSEFCENVRKAGFKIATDFNLKGQHLLISSF